MAFVKKILVSPSSISTVLQPTTAWSRSIIVSSSVLESESFNATYFLTVSLISSFNSSPVVASISPACTISLIMFLLASPLCESASPTPLSAPEGIEAVHPQRININNISIVSVYILLYVLTLHTPLLLACYTKII